MGYLQIQSALNTFRMCFPFRLTEAHSGKSINYILYCHFKQQQWYQCTFYLVTE